MTLRLYISLQVIDKLLTKHDVSRTEIEECFYNRYKGILEDSRAQHKTRPPTMWFIAHTDKGRQLKIVFIELNDSTYEIKTAYEPNNDEVSIYDKFG